MTRREAELQKPLNWAEYYKQLDFKRPRTRSLLDESVLFKTARLNNFEFKDVPQIILQMLRKEEEMSEDSLLNNGMMVLFPLFSFFNLNLSIYLVERKNFLKFFATNQRTNFTFQLASVSNLGSFDNLQTSQSLGELGLLDLKSVQVTDLEDDENLSPQEKVCNLFAWIYIKKFQLWDCIKTVISLI